MVELQVAAADDDAAVDWAHVASLVEEEEREGECGSECGKKRLQYSNHMVPLRLQATVAGKLPLHPRRPAPPPPPASSDFPAKGCGAAAPNNKRKDATTKLPCVIEETVAAEAEFSQSQLHSTSSGDFSSASSESSTHSFLKGAFSDIVPSPSATQKKKYSRKPGLSSAPKGLISLLLWPLKKLRDGYVRCMMGIDGNGPDLSAMVQGSSFYATSSKHAFSDLPLSKTDAYNHG